MFGLEWKHKIGWKETELILTAFRNDLKKLEKKLGTQQKQRITRHARNLDGKRRSPAYKNPYDRNSYYYKAYLKGLKPRNPGIINVKHSKSIIRSKYSADVKLTGGKLEITLTVKPKELLSPDRKKQQGVKVEDKIVNIHTGKWARTWPKSRYFFGFSEKETDDLKTQPTYSTLKKEVGEIFISTVKAKYPRIIKK